MLGCRSQRRPKTLAETRPHSPWRVRRRDLSLAWPSCALVADVIAAAHEDQEVREGQAVTAIGVHILWGSEAVRWWNQRNHVWLVFKGHQKNNHNFVGQQTRYLMGKQIRGCIKGKYWFPCKPIPKYPQKRSQPHMSKKV